MSDPLAPAAAGDVSPFMTSINTVNAVLDRVRGLAPHRPRPNDTAGALDPLVPRCSVYVRNDTAGTLPEFAVVKIGAPIIVPADAPFEAQRQPLFPGTAPAGATDAFAVLKEPAAADAVVRATVLGAAVCYVTVADVTHGYAAPAAGVTAALASAVSGPARILSAVTGTGTQLVAVLIGGGCCRSGPPPGAPTSLAGTATSGQVALTWAAPTGAPPAAQYVVEYSTAATMASPTQFTVTTGTSATVTGLTNGTSYYFGVYAVSATGAIGAYSNILNKTPLGAPTLVSATVQSNGTDLVMVFSRAVTGFTAGAEGFALTGLTGGATTLTYASGNGTSSVTMTISRTVTQTETGGALAYTAGDIVGSSDSQALASFGGAAVTNNSTQASGQEYTAAGSYTFTASYTGDHRVRVWGAGGPGAAGAIFGGTGGGGGAFSESVVALTNGIGYAVVVGAGGSGGSPGGDSTWETTVIVAKGGGTTFGGAAGSGTGTTKYSGGDGFSPGGGDGGGGGSSAGTAANGTNATNSTGATAPSGGGNGGNGGTGGGAGSNGSAPGGAGGGGAAGGGGSTGAAGKVSITWPA